MLSQGYKNDISAKNVLLFYFFFFYKLEGDCVSTL